MKTINIAITDDLAKRLGLDLAQLQRVCHFHGVSQEEWAAVWLRHGLDSCDKKSKHYDSEVAEGTRLEILGARDWPDPKKRSEAREDV